jgi:hypothetical protein
MMVCLRPMVNNDASPVNKLAHTDGVQCLGMARYALRNVDARRAFDLNARRFGMHLHRLDAFFGDRGYGHQILVREAVLEILQEGRDGDRVGEVLKVGVAAGFLAGLDEARLRDGGGPQGAAVESRAAKVDGLLSGS